ncbi:hypothetical protein [Deinococcus daejeonensis]|uniref:Uncharacterized protein n=1 Tax=Deinococcus daejeonensis TaxID=1007098 RepID=A0ABQ2IYY5_9DEIO|nr:hypothetical protein [Deinococcus daejeonensis]GGN35381.1 hypothetical protein GCM10010842_15140 [Deinococcus daejeonensis]
MRRPGRRTGHRHARPRRAGPDRRRAQLTLPDQPAPPAGPRRSRFLIPTLAALLWLGAGLWQRTQAGTPIQVALLAELPLTAAVSAVTFVWQRLRR